jgi:phage tail sheath protein FI
MPAYLHPGVYLEEVVGGARPVDAVATSVTAFVGEARRGTIAWPVLVHSLDDYEAAFGRLANPTDTMGLAAGAFYQNGGKDAYFVRVADSTAANTKAASLDLDGEASSKALTILAANEGAWGNELCARIRKANSTDQSFTLDVGHMTKRGAIDVFVADETFSGLTMNERDASYALTLVNSASRLVRLQLNSANVVLQAGTLTSGGINKANNTFSTAITTDKPLGINLNGLGARTIRVAAQLAGTSNLTDGQALAAAITAAVKAIAPTQDPYKSFSATYALGADTGTFVLTSPSSASASVVVSDSGSDPTSLAKILKLDPASAAASPGTAKIVPKAFPTGGVEAAPLSGGASAPAGQADYHAAFSQLKKVSDVSIIVLPGQALAADGGGNIAVTEALAHCNEVGNRMLIVDPPAGTELTTAAAVDGLQLPTSNYSALYYPWIKIPNPFYNPDTNATAPRTLTAAPSAFAAAMWSRTDGRRGVWKAPAGVEAQLIGVAGLEFDVGDGDQDQLNPLGVNCFRKLPSFGAVIWGARTLATKADPPWRYVPVRRTAIMIEQSIYNGIQWAVFEPNDHRLWSSLRVNIGAFMDSLFRAGAFQGEKASDAYFVRCGLGDTMTQDDIDRGQVIVVVGFAPLKPAEFVVVRIQQKTQQ